MLEEFVTLMRTEITIQVWVVVSISLAALSLIVAAYSLGRVTEALNRMKEVTRESN